MDNSVVITGEGRYKGTTWKWKNTLKMERKDKYSVIKYVCEILDTVVYPP